MKHQENLTETDLLPHDEAEDLAYAQKPYIDIAHIAMQEMQKLENDFLQRQKAEENTPRKQYTHDVPEEIKQRSILTTSQAALELGVSRPHLIKEFLDKGKLPFYMVGRHRRIRFSDLEMFKDKLYSGDV